MLKKPTSALRTADTVQATTSKTKIREKAEFCDTPFRGLVIFVPLGGGMEIDMKRKLTVITLVMAVILNICSAAFAYKADTLKFNNSVSRLTALGIVKSNVDLEANVTRGAFTSMAIKAFGYEAGTNAGGTAFADTEGNAYDSDISTAASIDIVTGDGTGSFLPDEYVSYNQAVRVMLAGMGYTQAAELNGGFPKGYTAIANDLGINKNVITSDKYIKMGDLITLIDNCIDAPLMKNAYRADSYKADESRTILSDYLRLEKYKVTVDGYDGHERKITVNKDGVQVVYRVDEYIILDELSYQTVYIYVGMDDDIVHYVEKMQDTVVYYDFICRINGSEADSKYPVSAINSVKLTNLGKSFELDDNALIRYNNDIVTGTAVNLKNCFAKVVMAGKKITVLDIYDLTEGGIIYRADPDMLKFIYQDTNDNKISGISKYGEVVIFIDGVMHYDMYDLQPDMIFDYWKDDSGDKEKFVIVASSRTAEGELTRGSEDEVVIDGLTYAVDGKFGPYIYDYGTDSYKQDKSITDALGHNVKVFVDDNMKVRYIKPDEKEHDDYNFYGVVVKAYDNDGEDRTVKLYKLSGSNGIKEYKVAKKLASDSIGFEYAKSVASDLDGRGVFQFELNNNFEIKSIKNIEYFDTVMKVSNEFEEYGSAYINGVYFANSIIFALYEDSDGFQVKLMSWNSNMKNYTASVDNPVIMTCDFDKRHNPFPNLVMLTNITDNFGYKNQAGGFVKSMSLVADDGGEPEYELLIQGASAENKFRLPKAYADSNGVKSGTWIKYNYGYLGDYPIHIDQVYDWGKPLTEWSVDTYSDTQVRGTYRADKILFRNNYAIQFEINGEPTPVYMFYDYMNVWKVTSGKKTVLEVDSTTNSIENVPRGIPCVFSVGVDQTGMQYSITNIYYESND